MRKIKKLFLLSLGLVLYTNFAVAREQIRGAGSSTLFPFITVVAETFGQNTKYRTPIIEATGTGGGFKLFCQGVGDGYSDFSNASREIKQSERDLCAKNGVTDIAEVKIGYDGIVLANSKEASRYSLKKSEIFLALARLVPQSGKLVENPYKKWSDINPALPNKEILIYGPPPTSGTRDAFVELVMQKTCNDFPIFKQKFPNKKSYKQNCSLIREDGVFVEAGENDNIIIHKLKSNDASLGIFGFSFLDQNFSVVQGSIIDGVAPTFENISEGGYGISRSLFVYIKEAHYDLVPGLKDFVEELVSEDAIGEDGYLTYKGLIPLQYDEWEQIQEEVLGN